MDILSHPVLPADHRIHYGADPSQFGDLWLPASRGPAPLVVFFHGGWWKSEYDLGYAGELCAALKHLGIATWSVEYRRIGATGGGWPGTFLDAAAAFDYVPTLAKQHPLDLDRVITMGHSAGGHLAFWVAGRHHVPANSEIFTKPLGPRLKGSIALAGAVDLRLTVDLAGNSTFAHDREEVYALMGGSPEAQPRRYHAGNPGDLLPFPLAQTLIQGTEDDQIPPDLPARWAEKSARWGTKAKVTIIPGADHFDVVDPSTRAGKATLDEAEAMLGR